MTGTIVPTAPTTFGRKIYINTLANISLAEDALRNTF